MEEMDEIKSTLTRLGNGVRFGYSRLFIFLTTQHSGSTESRTRYIFPNLIRNPTTSILQNLHYNTAETPRPQISQRYRVEPKES